MASRTCVGLGDFGTLKVERKRFIPVRTCRCGLLIAGENMGFDRTGAVYCIACRLRTKQRYYWARQMRAYFAAASIAMAVMALSTDCSPF